MSTYDSDVKVSKDSKAVTAPLFKENFSIYKIFTERYSADFTSMSEDLNSGYSKTDSFKDYIKFVDPFLVDDLSPNSAYDLETIWFAVGDLIRNAYSEEKGKLVGRKK